MRMYQSLFELWHFSNIWYSSHLKYKSWRALISNHMLRGKHYRAVQPSPCAYLSYTGGMSKLIRVLVLEDDLATLSVIMARLATLEVELGIVEFAVTTLSEYTQVEEYANKTKHKFDLVLLDRDCKAGGSFHALDFGKYQPNTIIGISSVPDYNKQLQQRGITQTVWKDYSNLEGFGNELAVLIEQVISTFKG